MTGRLISDETALGRPRLGESLEVRYGPDEANVADLRVPTGPGPFPVIVVLHGGCWRSIADRHYMGELAQDLTRLGWATWNLDYRTVDRPGGPYPGIFHDVASGTDRLLDADPRLDPARVVTLGHSAGAHLALWLAARRRVPAGTEIASSRGVAISGVVSLGGIADLAHFAALERAGCRGAVEQLIGGPPSEHPDRFAAADPAALLPLGVPQLLICGSDDPDVPPHHGMAYAAEARAAGDAVEVELVPEAGHFEVVAPWWSGWPRIRERIRRFLADRGGTE